MQNLNNLTLEDLLPLAATDAQEEKIRAYFEHGSQRAAARALGCSDKNIWRALDAAKKRYAQIDRRAHMGNRVPDGFAIKGTTSLYKEDGTVGLQWVKTDRDRQKLMEAMQASVEAMCEDIPALPAAKESGDYNPDLANVYTLTDCHIGMMAWRKEGGADWDLNIAEKTLLHAFADLIARSPNADTGIVAFNGDLLHYDGLAPVTPTSGHILDSDGRFSKMVQVTIKVARAMIDLALRKHKNVLVLIGEGNHDLASSVWLRLMFKALYENEPRVEFIDSELPYYAMRWGQTMLCWHHGHLKKNDQLPLMMAAQFPEIWGATKARYCHVGDKHHVEEKEHSGIMVVQHPTLAARDSYAARHGWHALRTAKSITYTKRGGERSRVITSADMF